MKILRRFLRSGPLLLLFIRELFMSALEVAWLAVRPRLSLRPAIIAYPLTVPSDVEITLLANLITLTPGTLSVDVSDDRKWLFVHCIDTPDPESIINDIAGGFETKVLEVFR